MDTKCPYCGEEMVLGYIRSRDGVVWAKDPSGISSIPWLASGPMVSLAPGTGLSGNPGAAGYNCTKCKKIILDYTYKNIKIALSDIV